MAPGGTSKVIAASCGLCAFAVALVAGLSADNSLEVILTRAIVSMIAVQLVGLLIGAVAERTAREAIEKYKTSRPIPEPRMKTAPADDEDVLTV